MAVGTGRNRTEFLDTPRRCLVPVAHDWPKITVVTPSYNQCPFLEATIRSVLLQDYPNLEYIIMDGGSSDGSVDLLRKYSPWLSHWESQPDGGQSEAIHRGLARSNGEIQCWINSDDFFSTGSFAHGWTALFETSQERVDRRSRGSH